MHVSPQRENVLKEVHIEIKKQSMEFFYFDHKLVGTLTNNWNTFSAEGDTMVQIPDGRTYVMRKTIWHDFSGPDALDLRLEVQLKAPNFWEIDCYKNITMQMANDVSIQRARASNVLNSFYAIA